MTWLYPRQRKKIITVNGIFDDFADTTFSNALWRATYSGSYGTHSFVSAPGSAGGNALKLSGTITDVYVSSATADITTTIGVSPFSNKGYSYFTMNPFLWSVRAEFRIYIEDDAPADSGTLKLRHSAGFCLDGNVAWDTKTNHNRIAVYFSVSNQYLGIGTNIDYPNYDNVYDLTKVSWSGAYNTWYDIRIEYSYNWYEEPNYVYITVYVNNVKQIDNYAVGIGLWRTFMVTSDTIPSHHAILGRCGPYISIEQDDVGGSGSVIAYYKDVLITQDLKFLEYQFKNSILRPKADISFKGLIITSTPETIQKGSDIAIYMRNNTNSNWNPIWRGKIHTIKQLRSRILIIEAEGNLAFLTSERTDILSFTTETAGTIIAGAINNPDKDEFDITTYFDSTTATYTREYINTLKLDIILEMSGLEGYFVFLDSGNNWHFQKYSSNQLDLHYEWGANKIFKVEKTQMFIRQPNILRVCGSGVLAERELPVEISNLGSRVVRTFVRYDLTTQDEIEEALSYYSSLYKDPIVSLNIYLRADFNLKIANVIRVTIPEHNIVNEEFIIITLESNHKGEMKLELIKVQPNLAILLSEYGSRNEALEAFAFASDTFTGTDRFNIDAEAKVLVCCEYEIEYDSEIVRNGEMIVTDNFIEALIDVWDSGSLAYNPHAIHYGTGTTEPKFSDDALENRIAGGDATTITKIEDIGYCEPGDSNFPQTMYRALELEYNITDPSALTEIGLFRPLTISNIYARAVFASYSQTGTVTIRIRIRFLPVVGSACITVEGISRTIEWCELGNSLTTQRPEITHLMHVGSPSFTTINPYLTGTTEFTGVTVVPESAGAGSITRTQQDNRNSLLIEYTYDYDYTNDKSSGNDCKEVGIVSAITSYTNHWNFVIFRRNPENISTKDGYSCKWILSIKFVRGSSGLI